MSEELFRRLEKIKASQDKFEDREDGKLRMRQEAFREGYAHGYKESRNQAIDECIKEIDSLITENLGAYANNEMWFYSIGLGKSITVLKQLKLKSEGER